MALPLFPDCRPLGLEDKLHLDQLFALLQPRASELTFAGLWLFRNAHHYRICCLEGATVIMGKGYDGSDYALPPLGGNTAGAVTCLLEAGMSLYGVDDNFLQNTPLPTGARAVEDRDNFDYLYLRHELATLPGNRFHKKKNRINYFLARHDCLVEPLTSEHTDACLEFLQEWGRVRGSFESNSFLPELEAAAEAVRSASSLGLKGLVALVGGRIRGLVLGERLNNDTSVCHFEKCDPFMDGLSQLLDREFNARLFTDCTYINREQDLGEPGLRSAKLSYHPVELVRKYRILPA